MPLEENEYVSDEVDESDGFRSVRTEKVSRMNKSITMNQYDRFKQTIE